MIRRQLDALANKIDSRSLRERALIFAAVAFALLSALNSSFISPLLAKQKKLNAEMTQSQDRMTELHTQLEQILQAKNNAESLARRKRIADIHVEMQSGDVYLQQLFRKLVQPEKMADLLEQVLNRNARVQLVSLQTLPATTLIETAALPPPPVPESGVVATTRVLDEQIYKHGVEMTLRGNYGDLLDYLVALEKLPSRMFWGSARMKVVQHPTAEITLTVYTLSSGATWLEI